MCFEPSFLLVPANDHRVPKQYAAMSQTSKWPNTHATGNPQQSLWTGSARTEILHVNICLCLETQ